MAVETSAVQITINVTDANSGAVVAGVTQNLQKLGSAGAGVRTQITGTAQSFQGFGVSGTVAGRVVTQNLQEVGKEVLSTREKTRLLSEEFGIRIPRAMQSLIAQSAVAKAALQSLTTVMVGLGAIQIGAIVFEALAAGAQKAWHLMTGLSKGTEDYLAEVQKTKDEDFGNARSIEDTRLRIDQATQSAKDFRQQAEAAKNAHGALGYLDITGMWQARSKSNNLSDQAAKAQAQADKLQHIQEGAQFHEGRVANIELLHAGDATLIGQKKITAEFEKRKALAAETRRFENEQDRILGNPVSPQSGASQEAGAVSAARLAAQAELTNLQKQQAQELAHLREAALEAGLRGEALYHAQEDAAIAELKNKDIDRYKAAGYISEKFHKEEIARLEDQRRETEKLGRAAALAGATGIAKIQGEGNNRIADLNADDKLDPTERAKRIEIVQKETNAQMADEQRSFSDQVDSIIERSQSRQISGFERIRAEAEKATNDLQKQFDKAHQLMDLRQPGAQDAYDKDAAKLGLGLNAIDSGAANQSSDLIRKNAEETSQIEAEARSKSMNAEKNQTAAIGSEYEERLRKYQEWKDQELSSNKLSDQERQSISEQFDRRVLAAGQIRDAEMVESAQRAREKMAGEFTRFFSNPMQALKEFGNKAAGEAAAALMQRMQEKVAGPASGGEHLGLPGGLDSLFGRGAGPGGEHLGLPGSNQKGLIFGDILGLHKVDATHDEASSKMLSVATAQIHVGSATISMGGGGIGPGGSTSLLGGSQISNALGSPAGGTSSPGDFGVSSGSTTSAGGFAGGGTTAAGSSPGGGVNQAFGNVDQGIGLFKQAKGLFGSKAAAGGGSDMETQSLDLSGSFDKSGNFNLGKSNSTLFNGGGMGAAMGAAGGAMGLYSAVQGNGGVGGALGGAMSGMQLGMALGGPIGAAIGAAGGAIVGAIGFGGIEKARVYDLKTVQPRITADILGYSQGTMDYTSAYSDLESLDGESRKALRAMGSFGDRYYWDKVNGEIRQAEGKLTAEERAGRSHFTATAAQFDIGADRVPRDGFAMIHQNERIMPSDQNERITRAIEAGSESTRMAADTQSGWGGDIHVHAIDAKSSVQWLMANKHNVRKAMNASYAENSGGADA